MVFITFPLKKEEEKREEYDLKHVEFRVCSIGDFIRELNNEVLNLRKHSFGGKDGGEGV